MESKRDVQWGIVINKIENLEKIQADMRTQQQQILEQLSLYKHGIMFVKCVGYTIAAVLAFKFGNIKDIWGGE